MSVFKDIQEDVQPNELNFIAEAFWKEFNDVIYCQQRKKFYQWTWQVYKEITSIDLLCLMRVRYPKIAEYSLRKRYEVIDNYKEFSAMNVEEFDTGDGLNFQNKYLDVATLQFHEHKKTRYTTILIPYDYDSTGQCPLFLATIKDIFMNDEIKINILQEFFGYCLTKDTRQEKAMFFVGEGGSGKSVILDCLQYILSSANVSYVSLRHFSDTIRLCSIENKLLNVCTEVPKKAEDYEENFKKIVTGEYIEVSQKYIPAYNIKPFCKLIFAVNQWPHIDDQSSAFYRRMLILVFCKMYPEEQYNKNLKEHLKAETSGILNWALEGLKRLRHQNGFTQSHEMKETIKEIKFMNNSILEWIEDSIIISPKGEVRKQEAYNKYTAWCRLNGYKPLGNAKFSGEIYRTFQNVTKKDYRHSSGDRLRVWPGIALVDNSQITIEPEAQASWDE